MQLLSAKDMSGIMLCLGLRFMSTAATPLCSPSTGDTAMLALRPGLVVVDLGDRVCGEEAALRDALRRLDDVLRWSMSSKSSRYAISGNK